MGVCLIQIINFEMKINVRAKVYLILLSTSCICQIVR